MALLLCLILKVEDWARALAGLIFIINDHHVVVVIVTAGAKLAGYTSLAASRTVQAIPIVKIVARLAVDAITFLGSSAIKARSKTYMTLFWLGSNR